VPVTMVAQFVNKKLIDKRAEMERNRSDFFIMISLINISYLVFASFFGV